MDSQEFDLSKKLGEIGRHIDNCHTLISKSEKAINKFRDRLETLGRKKQKAADALMVTGIARDRCVEEDDEKGLKNLREQLRYEKIEVEEIGEEIAKVRELISTNEAEIARLKSRIAELDGAATKEKLLDNALRCNVIMKSFAELLKEHNALVGELAAKGIPSPLRIGPDLGGQAALAQFVKRLPIIFSEINREPPELLANPGGMSRLYWH